MGTGDGSGGREHLCRPAVARDIEYIVLDRQPTEDERGGIVPAKAQLMFKKVGGDLYLRDPDGLGPSIVSIERIEA